MQLQQAVEDTEAAAAAAISAGKDAAVVEQCRAHQLMLEVSHARRRERFMLDRRHERGEYLEELIDAGDWRSDVFQARRVLVQASIMAPGIVPSVTCSL